MEKMWNPWHGCKKISDGCTHCYVHRSDVRYDRNAHLVFRTKQFDLPIRTRKNGDFVCPSRTFFWTCFSSDFLLHTADEWRKEAWHMIKHRHDCHFFFITKRISRFFEQSPSDWEGGYDHVTVGVTCENQQMADQRLPIFKSLPIKHKVIIHEPLLGPIDIRAYLNETIEQVVVGGESGTNARDCHFEWILDIRTQCIEKRIPFVFKQTGTYFVKDGKRYKIARRLQHQQAARASINYLTYKRPFQENPNR